MDYFFFSFYLCALNTGTLLCFSRHSSYTLMVHALKMSMNGMTQVQWPDTFCFSMSASVKTPNDILLICYICKHYINGHVWLYFFSLASVRGEKLDRCLEGMAFVTFQYILIWLLFEIIQKSFFALLTFLLIKICS